MYFAAIGGESARHFQDIDRDIQVRPLQIESAKK